MVSACTRCRNIPRQEWSNRVDMTHGAAWRQHGFLRLPGLSGAAISNNASITRRQCAKYHRLPRSPMQYPYDPPIHIT